MVQWQPTPNLKEPILLAVFSFHKNIFRGPKFNQPMWETGTPPFWYVVKLTSLSLTWTKLPPSSPNSNQELQESVCTRAWGICMNARSYVWVRWVFMMSPLRWFPKVSPKVARLSFGHPPPPIKKRLTYHMHNQLQRSDVDQSGRWFM